MILPVFSIRFTLLVGLLFLLKANKHRGNKFFRDLCAGYAEGYDSREGLIRKTLKFTTAFESSCTVMANALLKKKRMAGSRF